MADYGCWAWDENGAGMTVAIYFPQYPELEAVEKELDAWENWYWDYRNDEANTPFDAIDQKGLELTKKIASILQKEQVKVIYRKCWRPGKIEDVDIVIKE